jgi:hypothetical protein
MFEETGINAWVISGALEIVQWSCSGDILQFVIVKNTKRHFENDTTVM